MARTYSSVPLDEEESLNGNGNGNRGQHDGLDEKWSWRDATESIPERLKRISPHWMWVAHGFLLTCSILILALSYCVVSMNHGAMSRVSLRAAYLFCGLAPAAKAIQYEIQHFDLPPMPVGPFVGKGKAVDEAWEAISGIGDTMVSKDEMIKMGHDPEGTLQITDPDTGKKGYRVAVEVFHQLHCLNLLRQANYKTHYKPLGGDIADAPMDLHGHLDHCIDALRQFVMCQGDVNVFPFRFPFGDDDPWPDYAGQHVCRNFDAIRKWGVEHTVRKGKDEPEH
ncbi:hypothetical protein BJ878DRAFT_421308 [Calycina marina]|uniref:Uncharacterized protein n=1 Tax=Calycina marina TaxID=1763456 RepID=A0A9P7Z382_9HELO|nr:hypothetical protein BJ878DRAFT_421308 [Calycina marina]